MAKRLKLDIAPESNFSMLGIATTLSDYRLAHFLCKCTGLQFEQLGELETELKSGSFILPVFAARDKHNSLYYYLIPNKRDGLILFPSERRFDFWLLCGGDGDPELNNLGKLLQKTPNVQFCFEMDPSSIKESENFFEDVELGTMDILHRWKGRMSEGDAFW